MRVCVGGGGCLCATYTRVSELRLCERDCVWVCPGILEISTKIQYECQFKESELHRALVVGRDGIACVGVFDAGDMEHVARGLDQATGCAISPQNKKK